MSNLPEEVSTNLSSKIARINVLQKLVDQDRVNLRAKGLGESEAVEALNDEVKGFLLDLLYEELGGTSSRDPFAALGIEMTSEKAQALDTLLTRLTTPRDPRAIATMDVQSHESAPAPVAPPSAPPPAPLMSRVAPDGKRILSPVMDAIKKAAGGDEAWAKLPPEEKARLVKEQERQARITYQSTT